MESALKIVNAPPTCGRERFTLFGSTPSEEYISAQERPRWKRSLTR